VTFGLTRAGASCASSGLSACAAGCDIVLAMPSTGMVPPVVFRARSTPRDRRYMAQVAEVEVAKSGAVRVRRVVCAVDCGTVVHFRHHGSSLRRDQHQKRPRRANKSRQTSGYTVGPRGRDWYYSWGISRGMAHHALVQWNKNVRHSPWRRKVCAHCLCTHGGDQFDRRHDRPALER
jgi:hypothetical protein